MAGSFPHKRGKIPSESFQTRDIGRAPQMCDPVERIPSARAVSSPGRERGAALIVVLLFTVLMLILITTMLSVTGNEVLIARVHRDSIQALELAESGAAETVRRIEAGRPYSQGFAGSLDPEHLVLSVVRQYVGADAAYQEIEVTSTAGRATRRISLLVLQRAQAFLPNALRAQSVSVTGNAQLNGDVYAQTFARYQGASGQDAGYVTYAGWWMADGPALAARCYTHEACVAKQHQTWYPATRWAVWERGPLGGDIEAQTRNCPEGSGQLLPIATISGVPISDSCTPEQCRPVTVPVYGFDRDDPDGPNGPTPPQAVSETLPCGLPYKYEIVELPDDRNPLTPIPRLVKMIAFEQWFDRYWDFDESAMAYLKRQDLQQDPPFEGLQKYPQFGAIPPFPEFDAISANYDRLQNGGLITSGDFGCKLPEMQGDPSCPENADRPLLVVVGGDGSQIAAALRGYGTLVATNSISVVGGFEYWGRIVVNGTLTLGAGRSAVRGSMTVNGPMEIAGTFRLDPGGASIPIGRSVVIHKAWWER